MLQLQTEIIAHCFGTVQTCYVTNEEEIVYSQLLLKIIDDTENVHSILSPCIGTVHSVEVAIGDHIVPGLVLVIIHEKIEE